jgi:hypothetical protein
MRSRGLFLLVLLLASGCGRGYRGNGTYRELTRTYIPVACVTKGYMIEMPVFSAAADFQATYSLSGLPRINDGFNVQLLTYIPEGAESAARRTEINEAIPSTHEVRCTLVDKKTNRLLAEKAEGLPNLSGTPVPVYLLGPFLKCLLQTSFTNVPAGANLELRFEYRTGGVPLKRNMRVILLNDAPMA